MAVNYVHTTLETILPRSQESPSVVLFESCKAVRQAVVLGALRCGWTSTTDGAESCTPRRRLSFGAILLRQFPAGIDALALCRALLGSFRSSSAASVNAFLMFGGR